MGLLPGHHALRRGQYGRDDHCQGPDRKWGETSGDSEDPDSEDGVLDPLVTEAVDLVTDPTGPEVDPIGLVTDPIGLVTAPIGLVEDPIRLNEGPERVCEDPIGLAEDAIGLVRTRSAQ